MAICRLRSLLSLSKYNSLFVSSPSQPFPIRSFSSFQVPPHLQGCYSAEVDVLVSVTYTCYSDREAIANWMPFISSVKILPDKPDLSRWSLKYKAFGHDIEYSWLARNMQPIPNQKIHWRSLEGLPNKWGIM